MIIYAIILIKSNGTPILTEYFQSPDEIPNSELLGRMIIAIKGFTNEVLKEEMKTVVMENLAYNVKNFGLFSVIVVTGLDDTPFDIINEIGFRFVSKFGEDLLDKNIRVDKFQPFKKIISEVINHTSHDESGSLRPSKTFNTIDIYNLPADLQEIAMVMISLTEGSLTDISKELTINKEELQSKLDRLQKLGYIGKKARNSEIIFFCRTA